VPAGASPAIVTGADVAGAASLTSAMSLPAETPS
jgi:hypothetical protein